MCGIAGIVDFARGSERSHERARQDLLERMADSLGRRGPDARGVLNAGACGLAHTRLSVIDPEGSPQPMVADELGLALTYNGELYDYRELRDELVREGHAFRTAGDTEVLLRLLGARGSAGLERLDGMFAFALWNRREQSLLLARDRLGKKPLFWANPRPGLLVFGSEIKALLAHPEVDRSLDEATLRQVLRFRAAYGTSTLYRGVRQLEPGCALTFDLRGVRIVPYWRLEEAIAEQRPAGARLTDSDALERCAALLEASVRKRLVSDVPVGAFLSGGLDSSLVVATMCRLRGAEPTTTFSVGFRDDPHSELPHARVVAEHLGTEHHDVLVDENEYIASLALLSACRDAPVSEPADVAIARMSVLARQHVKVVLTGEGADEAFAGYPKYAFARTPAVARGVVRALGPERLAALAARLGVDRRRALVAGRALVPASEPERLAQWFSSMDRELLVSLLPGLEWSESDWDGTMAPHREALGRFSFTDPVLRMQALDALTWLPCNLLERGDRMTMAAGLEARFPFLDRELFPFGLALERRHKLRGRTSKLVLRRLGRRLLPERIVARRKWGFHVPLERWLRGALLPMLRDHLEAPDGLCATWGDRRGVERLLDAHRSGAVDASLALWTLLTAEVWYQHAYRGREGAKTGYSHEFAFPEGRAPGPARFGPSATHG